MLTGDVPFKGDSDYMTFNLIIQRQFEFPEYPSISDSAKDLISKLLSLDPLERGDPQSLKMHEFFNDIDFKNIESIQVPIERR
jgi:serine/threonine protein kinase